MSETDISTTTETRVSPQPSQLHQALAAIRGEVGAVPKDGKGAHNITYSTLDAISGALNKLMAQHGVSCAVVSQRLEAIDGGFRLTRTHKVAHGPSGEFELMPWDWFVAKGGRLDHTILGTTTVGMRYFLRDLFNLQCGEFDQAPEQTVRSKREQREDHVAKVARARALNAKLPKRDQVMGNGKPALEWAIKNHDLDNFIDYAQQLLDAQPVPPTTEELANNPIDEAFA